MMQYHEEVIYGYQTKSRDLLSKKALLTHFERMYNFFEYNIGKHLPNSLDASVLEVPCGYGNFLYYLKKKGYTNVVGYDMDNNQIELAHKLDLPARKGSAFDIIEEVDSQDVLVAIDFFEHLEKDDTIRYLQKCFSKLNTNGIFIIRVPSADGFFGMSHLGNDFTHKWAMTENAWKHSILPAIGFKTKNIVIKDERIMPKNIVAKIAFKVSNFMFRLFMKSLALGSPRILSRSMWIIAKKV